MNKIPLIGFKRRYHNKEEHRESGEKVSDNNPEEKVHLAQNEKRNRLLGAQRNITIPVNYRTRMKCLITIQYNGLKLRLPRLFPEWNGWRTLFVRFAFEKPARGRGEARDLIRGGSGLRVTPTEPPNGSSQTHAKQMHPDSCELERRCSRYIFPYEILL